MSNEGPESWYGGRRKMLALLGTVSTYFLTSGSILSSTQEPESDTRQYNIDDAIFPSPETEITGKCPDDGEKDAPSTSIEEHGGIEGDDSIEAAEQNVEAIHEASVADPENTVYLPEGKWYVGHTNSGKVLFPGKADSRRGSAGLGFVGDGPERSFLLVSPETPVGNGNIAIRYSQDSDHSNVEWRNITYEGNEHKIDFSTEGSQWGVQIRGSGEYSFENCRFRNFHANAILGSSTDCSMDFDRCTFYRNAIGRHNVENGDAVGHHIVGYISDDHHLRVTNTEFELVSGTCLDIVGGSESSVTISNCRVKGAGDAFIKVIDSGEVDISRLYFQGEAEELTEALSTEPGFLQHHGRYFAYRLSGDPSNTPTFILNDVVSHKTPYNAMQVQNGRSMAVIGGDEGPIVFSEIGYNDDVHGAFRDSASKKSRFEFDVGDLSVHETVGEIFRTPDSVGVIENLQRDSSALGDTGSIIIERDSQLGGQFEPDIPSKDEVGINSSEQE